MVLVVMLQYTIIPRRGSLTSRIKRGGETVKNIPNDSTFRFYRKLQKEIKEDYSRNKKEIKDGVPPTFEEYWRYLPHFRNTYHNSYIFTRYLIDLTKGLVDPGDWRKVDCVQVADFPPVFF